MYNISTNLGKIKIYYTSRENEIVKDLNNLFNLVTSKTFVSAIKLSYYIFLPFAK